MAKRILILVLCLLIIFLMIGCGKKSSDKQDQAKKGRAIEQPAAKPTPKPTAKPTAKPIEKVDAKVIEVIDGDTIKVTIGTTTETVRFIGVLAPKGDDCFSKEATDHAKKFLAGKTVKLGQDDQFKDRDEHGNLLRYVWFADGKTFFNEIAIEYGYALVSTDKPYKYQTEFEQAQKNAEETQEGLWHPDTCGGKIHPAIKIVNINSATLEELQTLPGIGTDTAQAIINGRPYEKKEDLLQVQGIGEKKLATIQDLIEIKAKINVNVATLEALQTLPGIGPETAQAIIDGRPYKKVEDLLKVKGIGEKKLAEIRPLIEAK